MSEHPAILSSLALLDDFNDSLFIGGAIQHRSDPDGHEYWTPLLMEVDKVTGSFINAFTLQIGSEGVDSTNFAMIDHFSM